MRVFKCAAYPPSAAHRRGLAVSAPSRTRSIALHVDTVEDTLRRRLYVHLRILVAWPAP